MDLDENTQMKQSHCKFVPLHFLRGELQTRSELSRGEDLNDYRASARSEIISLAHRFVPQEIVQLLIIVADSVSPY